MYVELAPRQELDAFDPRLTVTPPTNPPPPPQRDRVVLQGGPVDNVLIGTLGIDVLMGGDGDDVMIGGTEDFESGECSDPYLSMQHWICSIRAIGSHRWSRGKGVRVAIIDTGMDDALTNLVSSSETTRNFVDDESAFRADTHGTAVGGVIVADTDNAAGMAGVAPDIALLALERAGTCARIGAGLAATRSPWRRLRTTRSRWMWTRPT